MKFRIYRYDPEQDAKPYLKEYDVALDSREQNNLADQSPELTAQLLGRLFRLRNESSQ